MTDEKVKRVPVDFLYESINPLFLRWMSKVGAYAAKKYGSYEQYRDARLTGEKSPVNHMYDHLAAFRLGEEYDHFDGDVRWHLVAVAYNAMMEFYYVTRWGHVKHPLTVDASDTEPPSMDTPTPLPYDADEEDRVWRDGRNFVPDPFPPESASPPAQRPEMLPPPPRGPSSIPG